MNSNSDVASRTITALGPQLRRRKSIKNMVGEAESNSGQLRRTLGMWQLTMISVGATLGTGILVILGEAVPLAGPAIWISFAIAGVAALLSAVSYAEMAGMVPVVGVELLLYLRDHGRRHGLDLRLVPGPGIRGLRGRRRRRRGRVRQRDAGGLRPGTARRLAGAAGRRRRVERARTDRRGRWPWCCWCAGPRKSPW